MTEQVTANPSTLYQPPFTFSVKLSDLNMWYHTWQKNCVNCAVLTGSTAGIRTVVSRHLSHRELRSSLRESHIFLSLPADTTMESGQATGKNWPKKLTNLMGNLGFVTEHSVQFFVHFLHSWTAQFNWECIRPFRYVFLVKVSPLLQATKALREGRGIALLYF
jgi:hypothetical protein